MGKTCQVVRMGRFVVWAIPCLFIAPAIGGDQTALNEIEPPAYFDFWLGEWELTWEESDGTVGEGHNRIERILGGHVIKESFSAESGGMAGFQGRSWSVFNPRTGTWKQTWVDNNGAYLDFVGEFDGDRRIFRREGLAPDGTTIQQRMVFHDITEDALTWDWEVSSDAGESWDLRWRIHYQRAEAGPDE